MKKISINLRLFLWFSFLALLVIFTIWFSNTAILEKYYQYYKKENISRHVYIYQILHGIYFKYFTIL